MRRRAMVVSLPAWLAAPSLQAAERVRLAATWDLPSGSHRVGVLAAQEDSLHVRSALEVPSRAHGVWVEPTGSVLFVARRPGDWLLRWRPASRAQWLWADADRCFTGHALRLTAQPWLYTVETDLDSGQGLLVARDAHTLARQAEWRTGGVDPHQVVADADGTLLVANGGITTWPETGRAKPALDRMDASLVRLDPRSGRQLGQWRLDDARLSIRHLARHAQGCIGVALQAEHDDPTTKAQAPVLALFDGRTLQPVSAPVTLAGYGGDIAATAAGFCVSVPRAGGIAHWSVSGEWLGLQALPGACALAQGSGRWWGGGLGVAARWAHPDTARPQRLPRLQLDNHWAVLNA